jgi:hypothetical protein
MASRRETFEKLFKQETSDSGSLCHGSNPCEAVLQYQHLTYITLDRVKSVLPLFCHFYGSKIGVSDVLLFSMLFRIVSFGRSVNLISVAITTQA